MGTRTRTTARLLAALVPALLAAGCGKSGASGAPEAGGAAPGAAVGAAACPGCPECPACGPGCEAVFTSTFVTLAESELQTFQVKLMIRRGGKWFEVVTEDQTGIMSGEPVPNDEWKVGEELVSLVGARPDKVGDVEAGGLTWHQRGRAAQSWEYGPFEDTGRKALIVSTFRLLGGAVGSSF